MNGKKTSADLRSLKVWQRIADYANADLTVDSKALKSAEDLVRDLDERMSLVDLVGKPKGGESLEQRFHTQAISYQATIRALLHWLCRPMPNSRIPMWRGDTLAPIMTSPVDVLHGELSDERLTQQFDPQFDPELPDYYPFYFVREVRFHSLLGPICKFIVDQLEESGEMAPVRVCDRDGCGKFTVSERQGRKRFCSDQCRALAFQRSRDDWNEYMRNYRKVQKRRKAIRGKR